MTKRFASTCHSRTPFSLYCFPFVPSLSSSKLSKNGNTREYDNDPSKKTKKGKAPETKSQKKKRLLKRAPDLFDIGTTKKDSTEDKRLDATWPFFYYKECFPSWRDPNYPTPPKQNTPFTPHHLSHRKKLRRNESERATSPTVKNTPPLLLVDDDKQQQR